MDNGLSIGGSPYFNQQQFTKTAKLNNMSHTYKQQTKEAFISKESAKLLKKVGFDEPCAHFCNGEDGSLLPAPTQQRVKTWLFEQKDFFISVGIDPVTLKQFNATIYKKNKVTGEWDAWDGICRCEDPVEVNEKAILLILKYI